MQTGPLTGPTKDPSPLQTPPRRVAFHRRHRAVLPFVVVSLLLHLVAVLYVADWRRQEIEAEAFEARLRQIARFEPQRLTAERPVMTPRTEMEYRRVETAGPSVEELPAVDEPPPPPEVPETEIALRRFDVAVRADTFAAEGDDDVQEALANLQASRDSMRTESLELLRIEDMAQGHERAVVLIDPTSRRNITGYVNLTRLRFRGAGGGWAGLESLARFMRDHTDLLVQVRDRVYESVDDPALMEDPMHFLIEGGGRPLVTGFPLLQLSAEERTFLGDYMRQGGLLFVEGSGRFNAGAVELLKEVLGGEGSIAPLPVDHPAYHAFYTFGAGFPGENKRTWAHIEDLPPSWIYPAQTTVQATEAAGPLNLDPNSALDDQENISTRPDPLGLWGVTLGDTLVAVVSDLDMHAAWAGAMSQDEDLVVDSAPSLYAGVNLMVHALTRTGTTARRRALPAWAQQRPDAGRVSMSPPMSPDSLAATTARPGQVDPGLYDALDASVALVRAPLGTALGRGGVTVRVNGQHRVDLLRATRHGVLLHNLDPGTHWIEVEYDGEVEGMDVDLRGGSVTTVTFGVRRLAMLHRVHLEVQPVRVPLAAWATSFSDLDVEEVFLQADDALTLPP